MKAYGWYAVGIYAVVSIVDFGAAFLAIKLLGAEYVSSLAAVGKAWLFSFFSSVPAPDAAPAVDAVTTGQEGLYAMLVLAYTVHKTLLLPVRIGVTATFTPRIVGWLRTRGWAGSTGTRAAIQDIRERVQRRD
jgi:hypothetical protein